MALLFRDLLTFTELEIKTAEIETKHVEDDPDNQNNDNSVEIDQDMNKPLVEF